MPLMKRKEPASVKEESTFLKIFGARALDNAAYMMVLDHVGLEADQFEFPGLSMAFDPFGDVIAETEPFRGANAAGRYPGFCC